MAKRRKHSIPLSARYSQLPIGVERPHRRHVKRKHATLHFSNFQNQDSFNESFIIEWSSDESTPQCTPEKSIRSSAKKKKLSKCQENILLDPLKKLRMHLKTANDTDDENITIEWSSSEDESKVKSLRKYDNEKENYISNARPYHGHHQSAFNEISSTAIDRQNTNHTSISTESTLQLSMECTPSQNCTQKKKLSKRCRPGGYLEQYQENMKSIKASRKFLEFDKKYGLRKAVDLRVLEVENSFGVHLATVVTPNDKIAQIVLYAENAKILKPGSILESFMEQTEPYEIERNDGIKKIYLQPHKFIQP